MPKKVSLKRMKRKINGTVRMFDEIKEFYEKVNHRFINMNEEDWNKDYKAFRENYEMIEDSELYYIFKNCDIKNESELHLNPLYQHLREDFDTMSLLSAKKIAHVLDAKEFHSEALYWIEKMIEKVDSVHTHMLLLHQLIIHYRRLNFHKEAMKTCELFLKLYKSKIEQFDKTSKGSGYFYQLIGISASIMKRYNEAYFYLKKAWNGCLKRPNFDIFDIENANEKQFAFLFYTLRAAFKSKPYKDVLHIINHFPSPISNMRKCLPNGLNISRFENHVQNLKTLKHETVYDAKKSADKVYIYFYVGLICQLKGETLIHLNDKTFVDWIKKADKIYNNLLLAKPDWPHDVKNEVFTEIIARKIGLLVILKEFKISGELMMLSSFEDLKVYFEEPFFYYFMRVDVKRRLTLNYIKETFTASEDDRLGFVSYKNSLYINDHLRINNKELLY